MVLAGISVLFAIAIGLVLLKYKDIKLAFTCHAMAGFATMLVVFSFILPSIANRLSVKQVANYYTENCDMQNKVYVDKFLRPGFMYYTHVPGEEMKPKTNDIEKVMAVPQNKYLVVRGLEYRTWDDNIKNGLQEIYSTGDLYLLKATKNAAK